MEKQKVGVLVMSYGTPQSMDDVEAYYTHIRRGNKPSPEQLGELTSRYEAIVGGVFPLREHTDNQVSGLQKTLQKEHPDVEFVCYQGLKHAQPFIEDGVDSMAESGIKEAVGIVLAPHYSTMSIASYNKRAKEKAAEHGIKMACVDSYHLHPKLLQALSERIERALEKFADADRSSVRVLFSAHSLPEKILELGDPYPEQLLETSRAVAEKTGVTNWQFAWQSAGRTAAPWLGPDILDVLRSVSEEGVERVLICPIGFVSDHLEVLYDIDIECRQAAEELGLHLERTESLNTDPLYMETLSDAVWNKYGELKSQD
ncbi:ferrochelatase [Paenibacillus sp. FJAT-26967]|uniref:ferrochelatase n=1 Tax=Paenibacillus sp. FJAT-26967 TaxID=1729690 RepID=UPI000839351B|nr:ferrochelatase [Paenibacillus sp. FJAT-26967]